jgi:hypothetical protein
MTFRICPWTSPMADSSKGQALVEYVLVLVVFSAVSLTSWNLMCPTLSNIFQNFSGRVADVAGMQP